MKRRQLLASLPAIALLPSALRAAPYYGDGVILQGYDVVAYFTEAAAVPGDPAISTEWDGAMWYYSSIENRDAFLADPEAYAPQYGAFCAYAVARGASARAVPEAWTVYDGKLYVNFSLDVRDRWRRDIPGEIARGDANWPDVRSRL